VNFEDDSGLEIFEKTFEKAGVGIAHVDANGHWVRVNQYLCDFLGYTKDELLTKTFQEITYTQDLQSDLTHANELRTGAVESFSINKRYIHKNGFLIWANLTATVVRDENGDVKYYIAIIKDIIFQMALQESQGTLKYMLEMSPIAVRIAHKNRGSVVFSNNAYAKMIHEDADNVMGKNPRDYYVDKEQYDEIVTRVKRKEVVYNKLMQLRIKGEDLWQLCSFMSIRFEGEESVLGWFYDVTELQKSKFAIEQMSLSIKQDRLFLQTLIDSAPIPIFYKDISGVYLGVNSLFLELLDITKEQIIGKTIFDYAPYEIALVYQQKDKELIDNPHEVQIYEFIAVNKKSGKSINMVFYKKVYYDENANIAGIIGSALDITEQKESEARLTHQKNELETIFNISRDGIAILDKDSRFLEFNESYMKMTGFTREELMERSCLSMTAPQDIERVTAALATVYERGHVESFEKQCIVKDGRYITISMSIALMPDKERALVSAKDITELKKHEKQLEYIAHYDTLTGLPNRILKTDRLRQAMVQLDRKENGHIAVLYLDLDGFKEVNDTYGHSVGDQLLIDVSSRMKSVLREGDTLSRLGGDEFVAVITDLEDVSAAIPLVKRLLAAASKPVAIEDHLIQVSASIGVTFFPQAADVDGDQLIRQADQAMYEAKQFGKNRYHVFDPTYDQNIRAHHENIERIREALENEEFVLYFQPKVNMQSGEIIGSEALIRWNHPQRGIVSPAEFLPIIEEHSLSIEIGEWVIDAALKQLQEWKELGIDLHVSVNIGAKQLLQANFIDRLEDIFCKYSAAVVELLEMEMLETSALEDVVKAANAIERCKNMGVHFSLDDFGTGYSSLSYLKRLPVMTLKIDQSFVRDMLEDPDDLAILEGIIGLASAFKKSVIAEGVETIEHGKYLLKLGCKLAQGYAIARPMPPLEFLKWRELWIADSFHLFTKVS
jgi:diguanylate cyclase (GGDEF)-like protein/PAS domain S-box-containing protein